MEIYSRYKLVIQILLLGVLWLASHGLQAATLSTSQLKIAREEPVLLAKQVVSADSLSSKIVAEQIQVDLSDIFTFSIIEFLNAKGNVTPEPDAYHPEYGEPGYLDSYYGMVDPQGKRTTLNAWREENDFNSGLGFVKSAEYINAADLGFGRKMYCLDNGRTSCYVQNYLDPETTSDFAATVAMERMPAGYVAFFVYDAAGNRINQIALDSEGPKSVPESCWACHGGHAHGSSFYGGNYLPFDVDNLKDWPGHPTRAAQLDDFQDLNDIVWGDAEYSTDNQNLVELLEQWYDGPPFYNSASYSAADVPDSWYTNPNGDNYGSTTSTYKDHQVEKFLYKEVYSEYCRMCHVAQEVDWQTAHAGDFALAATRHICEPNNNWPRMPHAEVTYNKFFNEKHHFHPLTGPTYLGVKAVESSASLAKPVTLDDIKQVEFSNERLVSVESIKAAEKLVVAEQLNLGDVFEGIIAVNGHTGAEMLCDELGLSFPSGNVASGQNKYTAKGCVGCHFIGYENYDYNKTGGNLECKGAWLRQDMGSINPAMYMDLNFQDMQDLAAYLNSDSDCN